MASNNASEAAGKADQGDFKNILSNADAFTTTANNFTTTGNNLIEFGTKAKPIMDEFTKWWNLDKFNIKSLREWAKECIHDGSLRQPVLTLDKLKEHLEQSRGHPTPPAWDKTNSSLAWAQLLYALNIRPEKKILEWKTPPRPITDATKVSLVIEGEAMCHIINLFRKYDDSVLRKHLEADAKLYHCDFPFGKMDIDDVPENPGEEDFSVTFKPGTDRALQGQRVPFSIGDPGIHDSHLRFDEDDKETLMTKYWFLMRCKHPLVRGKTIDEPPSHEETLKERAEYFIQGMELLTPTRLQGTTPGKTREIVDWDKPCVVREDWLRSLESIKRRLTTDGGETQPDGQEELLSKALLEYFMGSESFKNALEDDINRSDIDWAKELKNELTASMLFKESDRQKFRGSHLRFYWSEEFRSERAETFKTRQHMRMHLPEAMRGLGLGTRKDWLRKLAGLENDLARIIGMGNEFRNYPAIVLELYPGHSMWNKEFAVCP